MVDKSLSGSSPDETFWTEKELKVLQLFHCPRVNIPQELDRLCHDDLKERKTTN
jgi:hypothetical protein